MMALRDFLIFLAVCKTLHVHNGALQAEKPNIDTTAFALEVGTKDISQKKEADFPVTMGTSTTDISPLKERSMKDVKGCPDYCKCELITKSGVDNKLTIRECSRDPTQDLSNIISLHNMVPMLEIVNACLPRIPCEALLLLGGISYLDFSGNAIHIPYCEDVTGLLILETLILRHNNIGPILYSYDLSYLRLDTLDLSHNIIQDIPNLSELELFTLILDHNQLQTLPCNLTVLSGLRYLDLGYNKINKVFCDLTRLRQLQTLYLSHNKLLTFPCNITTLSGLAKLDLSYNHIQSVPCELSGLSALEELDLSNNLLETLQGHVGYFRMLLMCNLSRNNLKAVSYDIFKLTELKVLRLQHNALQVIDCSISGISSLGDIDFSHNKLSVVPLCLLSLRHLHTVDLSYNYLQTMPGELTAVHSLLVLNLSNNMIHSEPWELYEGSELTSLDLSHNKLDQMSCNVTKLTCLETLDLSYNSIRTVLCNFSSLPDLIYLELSHNNIVACPQILSTHLYLDISHNLIDAAHCNLPNGSNYLGLDVGYNEMKTFPCDISMADFSDLTLSHNEIDSVRCKLSQMAKLTRLLLTFNRFDCVPCNLSTLPSLKVLDLSHNHIRTIPVCLRKFTCLQRIVLDFNEISVLTSRMFYGVQELSYVSLHGNKLVTIEPDVFLPDPSYGYQFLLDLGYNALQKLDSWPITIANNVRLFLEVTNNSISEFSNEGKLPITSCLKLYSGLFRMINNDIRHIMDVFNGWNVQVTSSDEIRQCMTVFDFSNNPLVCDRRDYEIYRTIHGTEGYLSKNLTCRHPAHLNGQNPAFVPLDRFVCKVTDKCPEGCLCYDTPHSRNLSVICSEYKRKELPAVLPDLPGNGYSYYLLWRHTQLETISLRAYFRNTAEAVFSQNMINNVTLAALGSLVDTSKLFLDNNHLLHLPHNLTSVKLTPSVEIKLANNHWVCDCRVLAMKEWLITNKHNIQDAEDITCFSPPHHKGKQIIHLDRSVVCSPERFDDGLYIVITILVGIICILFISLSLVCVIKMKLGVRAHKRKDWEPVDWDEEADDGKEFDVFVSYSNEDEDYVGGNLIPELEERGFKVCFHRVYFLAGKSIIDNICECIAKSKKVLAFYSMEYQQSDFGMYEYTLAMQLDVQNGTNRLVTIVDTDLDIENLQLSHSTYLRTHSYVIKDEPTFWRNLLYTFPKHTLGGD